jgi:hypothetical protein
MNNFDALDLEMIENGTGSLKLDFREFYRYFRMNVNASFFDEDTEIIVDNAPPELISICARIHDSRPAKGLKGLFHDSLDPMNMTDVYIRLHQFRQRKSKHSSQGGEIYLTRFGGKAIPLP